MKTIKLELEYINTSKKVLFKCNIESIYTDIYIYNEQTQKFDEDEINFEWIDYLAAKQINISNSYLHSFTIINK